MIAYKSSSMAFFDEFLIFGTCNRKFVFNLSQNTTFLIVLHSEIGDGHLFSPCITHLYCIIIIIIDTK